MICTNQYVDVCFSLKVISLSQASKMGVVTHCLSGTLALNRELMTGTQRADSVTSSLPSVPIHWLTSLPCWRIPVFQKKGLIVSDSECETGKFKASRILSVTYDLWLPPSSMIPMVNLRWLFPGLYTVALAVCKRTVFFVPTHILLDNVAFFGSTVRSRLWVSVLTGLTSASVGSQMLE